MSTVFSKSVPGREGVWPERPKTEPVDFIPQELLRGTAPNLPSLSELDVVRHFTTLSAKNYSVDGNFYPLGSCTMTP